MPNLLEMEENDISSVTPCFTVIIFSDESLHLLQVHPSQQFVSFESNLCGNQICFFDLQVIALSKRNSNAAEILTFLHKLAQVHLMPFFLSSANCSKCVYINRTCRFLHTRIDTFLDNPKTFQIIFSLTDAFSLMRHNLLEGKQLDHGELTKFVFNNLCVFVRLLHSYITQHGDDYSLRTYNKTLISSVFFVLSYASYLSLSLSRYDPFLVPILFTKVFFVCFATPFLLCCFFHFFWFLEKLCVVQDHNEMLIQAHEKLKEPLQDCRDGVIVMISMEETSIICPLDSSYTHARALLLLGGHWIASLQCVCLHMCCLNVICNHQATRPSFLLRISLSLLSLNQNMSLWSSHHVSLTYMYCSIANHAMNIITWKKSILTSEHVTSQSIQSPPAAFISHFNIVIAFFRTIIFSVALVKNHTPYTNSKGGFSSANKILACCTTHANQIKLSITCVMILYLWDLPGLSPTGGLSSASAALYIPQLEIYHLSNNKTYIMEAAEAPRICCIILSHSLSFRSIKHVEPDVNSILKPPESGVAVDGATTRRAHMNTSLGWKPTQDHLGFGSMSRYTLAVLLKLMLHEVEGKTKWLKEILDPRIVNPGFNSFRWCHLRVSIDFFEAVEGVLHFSQSKVNSGALNQSMERCKLAWDFQISKECSCMKGKECINQSDGCIKYNISRYPQLEISCSETRIAHMFTKKDTTPCDSCSIHYRQSEDRDRINLEKNVFFLNREIVDARKQS
ncbi:hypothetical protein VP01_179g1 [Puccinia sorghi]|uniref:Uncharacterized protein n=1 Tax=Puccinia sorghi TaxID=27349 RepID=A0A0L6VEG2_9BASI|nr:hypothetical protein VP01_179g1 [Puccinia sorghi]